jgi:hypothetical protein
VNFESLRPSILILNHQDNRAYQLAALEQQDRLHDTLNELNRSLLINREKLHADIGELSLQVDGLREDLNRFLVDPVRGAQHSKPHTVVPIFVRNVPLLITNSPNLGSKQRQGRGDSHPVGLEGLEGYKPLGQGGDHPTRRLWTMTRLRPTPAQILTGTQDLPFRSEGATRQLLHIRGYQASPPGRRKDQYEPEPVPTVFALSRGNSQVKDLLG